MWRARAGSGWPGYSPASSRPGSTHQACTKSSCGHGVRRARLRRPTNSPRARATIRSAATTFSRHAAGMPDAPQRAPASWPAIAAVVSASSPRFAARSTALAEVVGAGDGPERRFECVDAVAGPADRRRGLRLPRAGGDVGDRRVQVAPLPERRRGDLVEGRAADERAHHGAHEPAGVDRPRSPRGSFARTHRRARPRSPGRRASGSGTAPRRISEPLAADSSSGWGSTASPVRWNRASWVRVVMPMSKQRPFDERYPDLVPQHVAAQLVLEVELASVEQRLGEAQRHRGVVGPLARLQAERAAADHVVDRLEGARRAELERRADGVAAREAEQRADGAVERVHRVSMVVGTSCP